MRGRVLRGKTLSELSELSELRLLSRMSRNNGT